MSSKKSAWVSVIEIRYSSPSPVGSHQQKANLYLKLVSKADDTYDTYYYQHFDGRGIKTGEVSKKWFNYIVTFLTLTDPSTEMVSKHTVLLQDAKKDEQRIADALYAITGSSNANLTTKLERYTQGLGKSIYAFMEDLADEPLSA